MRRTLNLLRNHVDRLFLRVDLLNEVHDGLSAQEIVAVGFLGFPLTVLNIAGFGGYLELGDALLLDWRLDGGVLIHRFGFWFELFLELLLEECR